MKQFLIIAILGCLGWNAQAEGTLRLLNTKFDHPQLRDWAAAHPNLVTAQLQRGLDVMGLQDAAGEGKLSQAADSLGLAHGFLTFDYRISGLLASFTEETAGKLLPEIQQKMGAEFGVGAGQPYALLITWVSFQGKLLELLFHVNYEGFSRKSSYTTEQLALYKDLSASVFQTGDDEVNAILKIGSLVGTAWSRSASTVMKLYLLLSNAPIPGAYFRVAGRSYGANDTLFLCICDSDTVQITAYQSPNVLFPVDTKWKGFKNSHPSNGPIAGFERNNSTNNAGIFIEASFKDQTGQNQSAALRVVVVEVDFSSASNTYFFDPNEIKEYNTQYEKSRKILNKPKRWVFIPENMQEQVNVTSTPRLPASHLRTSAGALGILSNSRFSLANPGTGTHQVFYNNLRCDSLELGVFSEPILDIRAIAVIVDDLENDDTLLIQPGTLVPANTVCITAGPNGIIDSPGVNDDIVDKARNEIRCGPDLRCSSNIPIKTNTMANNTVQTSLDSVVSVYRKAGVNLNIRQIREAVYYDRNRNDTLDVGNYVELNQLNKLCQGCNGFDTRFFFVQVMGLIADANGNLGYVQGIAPRGSNRIYINGAGNDVIRTLAHEFGHGQFSLRHPWDEFTNYNNTQARVLTGTGTAGQDPANLMDYQNGWKLRKYQWIQIH